MHLKRVFISIILIFSYTVGFAHSIIPHCDNLFNGSHIHNISEEHNHNHLTNESHEDHEHITHGNHFDEGIYDLIICLFSDLDHGASECNMQHNTPLESSIDYGHQENSKIISTFVSTFGTIEEVEKIEISKLSEISYNIPELNAHSLRGPPTL